MSGGHFNYNQHLIREIADRIQKELDRQGKKKSDRDLYFTSEYYNEYQEETLYRVYPQEIQDKMREAVNYLKIAYVYAHRTDWFLSGDDGDESYIRRLEEDLKKI